MPDLLERLQERVKARRNAQKRARSAVHQGETRSTPSSVGQREGGDTMSKEATEAELEDDFDDLDEELENETAGTGSASARDTVDADAEDEDGEDTPQEEDAAPVETQPRAQQTGAQFDEEEVMNRVKQDRISAEHEDHKDELRSAVAALRSEGMTIRDIAKELHMKLTDVAVLVAPRPEDAMLAELTGSDIPVPTYGQPKKKRSVTPVDEDADVEDDVDAPPPLPRRRNTNGYGQPQPVDPFMAYVLDNARRAEERQWRAQARSDRMMLMMMRGNNTPQKRGDGLFDGQLGDMLKAKIVTGALNLGGAGAVGGGSEFMQIVQTLISSGQLQSIGTEAIGLVRDIMNKDNPNYNPFEGNKNAAAEATPVQEDTRVLVDQDYIDEIKKRFPKVPEDIVETAVAVVLEEQPEAKPKENFKAMLQGIKAMQDLQDGCIALNRFVIKGDKTMRDAAMWLRQKVPQYATLLASWELEDIFEKAAPYEDTPTMGKYIRWLKKTEIRAKIEEMLKFLKNPELLKNPMRQAAAATAAQSELAGKTNGQGKSEASSVLSEAMTEMDTNEGDAQ